jgi:demethylmenaquinone methyltransferase/2-methoxy-6-polyprenyl-1,4-benzoquinol methylase
MLVAAGKKIRKGGVRALLIEGDALRLPLPAGCLDVMTVAFGFRNLVNYRAGLKEMLRVLKPGGTAVILEFSQPRSRVLARSYGVYSRKVVPRVGGRISGSREAYWYLPESVSRFPDAEGLAGDMRAAGFIGVDYELLAGGIVALHSGEAPWAG